MVSNITFSPRANVNFSGINKAETQLPLNFKQQPADDLVSFSGTSVKNTSDMMKDYYPKEHAIKIISKIGTDNVKIVTNFVADGEPKTEAQINNLLEQVSTNLQPDEKNTLKNLLTKTSENISKLSDEDKLKFKEGCKKLEELTQKADPENKDKFGCIALAIIFLLSPDPFSKFCIGLPMAVVGSIMAGAAIITALELIFGNQNLAIEDKLLFGMIPVLEAASAAF